MARSNLAKLARDRGRREQAEARYREVLADHRRVLGPDHPGTLFTAANLGQLLLELDRLAEAAALFRELLPVAERVFGLDHPVSHDARRHSG